MTDPFDAGYELFRQEPELLLVEVWHRAPVAWSDADREAFVMGYIVMRRKRNEYDLENNND